LEGKVAATNGVADRDQFVEIGRGLGEAAVVHSASK